MKMKDSLVKILSAHGMNAQHGFFLNPMMIQMKTHYQIYYNPTHSLALSECLMTCPRDSGCIYTKEGKRREHNFPREKPPPYIDNTKFLLDLIRPWNRIVPTDNMTLRIRVQIVFSLVLYLAWFSLQKYHTPVFI